MAEIRIYTTDACGYCTAAKRLLEARGAPFEEVDCSEDAETRRWLVEKTGRRTVPQIFIGGIPIGGYDDLKALDQRGELAKILAGEAAPTPIL